MERHTILEPHHADTRLDVARGVSALVVFVAHLGQLMVWRLVGADSAFAAICDVAAHHAVLVFFLLSGHLITKSVLANIRRNGHFSIADYVAARIARIYPPLVGAVLICLAVWATIHGLHMPGGPVPLGLPGDLYPVREYFTISMKGIVDALTMRGGLLEVDTPLWSLFIEVQIYGLVLAIAAFWQSNWIARCWAVVVGLAAARLLQDQKFLVLLWAVGALTAVVPISRRTGWMAAIGGTMIVFAVALWHPDLFRKEMMKPAGLAVQMVCATIYAAVLFYSYPKLRYPAPLVATANFSYSLYVMHFPLLVFALSLSQAWVGHSLGRALLVVLLAAIAVLGLVIPLAAILEQPQRIKAFLLRRVSPILASSHIRIYSAASLVALVGICTLAVYRHFQQCRPVFDEQYTYIPTARSPTIARVFLIPDVKTDSTEIFTEPLFRIWIEGLARLGADVVVLNTPVPKACWFSDGGRRYRAVFLSALNHIKTDAAARYGQPSAVFLSGVSYGGLHAMEAFAADPRAYNGWQAAMSMTKITSLPNLRAVRNLSAFDAFQVVGELRGSSGFLSQDDKGAQTDRDLVEDFYRRVQSPRVVIKRYKGSGRVVASRTIEDLLSNARMQFGAQ